jgi:translation initiation factor 3 subunit F
VAAAAPAAVSAALRVQVHPVVLLAILDHHTRRNEQQERVFGTLLGFVNEADTIEVRNSFPVPCVESEDQVMVDMHFHHTLAELHQRVNRKEQIVGWYATGPVVNDNSVLVHSFYTNQCAQPVHLQVDTALTDAKLGIKAYVSNPAALAAKEEEAQSLNSQFVEVKVDIKTSESERIGVDTLIKATKGKPVLESSSLASDLEGLDESFRQLLEMIGAAERYVESVVDGTIQGDEKIGRHLFDTVTCVPQIEPEVFEKMFSSSVNDLLMVVYLANLTKVQLSFLDGGMGI